LNFIDNLFKDLQYSQKLYYNSFVTTTYLDNREFMIGVPKEMKKLSLEELGLIYETTLNRVFVFPLEMFVDKAVLRKIKNMNQDNDNFAYLETQLKQGTHFELLNYIERLAQFEENNVYLISRFSKPFVSYLL